MPLFFAVILNLALAPAAFAKRPTAGTPVAVPTIAEVVEREGFIATPSQSEIYRPGAVLVPNQSGGHDVVVGDCVASTPTVSLMSQSSIATTLAGGVSTRLSKMKAGASAGVEKRLSFVDPEQRTIALGDLIPTEGCIERVVRASSLQNLQDAIVINDVLVAMVKSTVCVRSDANGAFFTLAQAEAQAYSECVQESPSQVPLGYKGVPLSRVLTLAPGGATLAPVTPQTKGNTEISPKSPQGDSVAVEEPRENAAQESSPSQPNRGPPKASYQAGAPSNPSSKSEGSEAARYRRGLGIGAAVLVGATGAVAGSIGLAQRTNIRDGLQSGTMTMSAAQARMPTVNRNLIIAYSGLSVGIAVGGWVVWSAQPQAGGASLSAGGTW